jgi:hypothetical protein
LESPAIRQLADSFGLFCFILSLASKLALHAETKKPWHFVPGFPM